MNDCEFINFNYYLIIESLHAFYFVNSIVVYEALNNLMNNLMKIYEQPDNYDLFKGHGQASGRGTD